MKNFVLANDVAAVQAVLAKAPPNELSDFFACDETLLCLAAEKNFVSLAQLLLDAKADVNQQGEQRRSPLLVAAMEGHTEMLNLLLAQPEVVLDACDAGDETALMYAASHGLIDVVRQLLAANVSMASINGGLHRASGSGYCEIAQLLLEHKAVIAQADCGFHWLGRGCLHVAVERSHDATVALLLGAKASPNCIDKQGRSPLMEAAKHKLSVVQLLLAARADVKYCSRMRETPLLFASFAGHVEICDELLRAGADPNVQDVVGRTPLSYLTKDKRNMPLISLLADAKADINAADKNGDTPLVHAVFHDNAPAAQLLLERGATWLPTRRKSPRQLARNKSGAMPALFACALCGWEGMCCYACRTKYCRAQCDKFCGAVAGARCAHAVCIRRHLKQVAGDNGRLPNASTAGAPVCAGVDHCHDRAGSASLRVGTHFHVSQTGLATRRLSTASRHRFSVARQLFSEQTPAEHQRKFCSLDHRRANASREHSNVHCGAKRVSKKIKIAFFCKKKKKNYPLHIPNIVLILIVCDFCFALYNC